MGGSLFLSVLRERGRPGFDVVVGLIIVVALFRLTLSVATGLLWGAFDPLDQAVFQSVFGEILTLLIALEFNHTLQYVVAREQSIIQIKVVLLIVILALARKFIVLDLHEVARANCWDSPPSLWRWASSIG